MRFSPRARGSTLCRAFVGVSFKILPACAGVNLKRACAPRSAMAFSPHVRGSTPVHHSKHILERILPACAGVNPAGTGSQAQKHILPACAGVNPAPPVLSKGISDSPRMRGGHPNFGCWKSKHTQFTPHARGSTQPRQFSLFPCNGIHPACARVNPPNNRHSFSIGNSPCMCGGQPGNANTQIPKDVFSPHARGSTWQLQDVKRCTFIFPACAGGNPAPPVISKGISYSPRMRGGSP